MNYGNNQATTYTISQYETMYSIAEKFGVSLQELMAYNNLTDYSPIYPGQVIHIPPRNTTPPNTVYTVRRGDTLASIARRFGVSVQNIMSMNGLRRPNIYPGQRLAIPMAITPL